MITIGIVLYNEEKQMPLLLRNLRVLQSFSSKISVIIVDNASIDKTASFLKSYQQEFAFTWISRTENNLGEARQDVIREAVTEWVGFIDGDCGINEQWAENILKIAPTISPKVAAFGGPWIAAGLWKSHYQSLFRSPMGNFSLPQLSLDESAVEVFHIPTANVIYRKVDVVRAGGFRSDFAFVGEDLDLSCRLHQQERSLVMYSHLPIEHYLPSSLKQWWRKIFFYGRGRVHVASQNGQWNDRILILPILFLLTMATSIALSETRVVAAYLLVTFVVSAVFSEPKAWITVWMLAMSTHFSYALGMAYEWSLQLQKLFGNNKPRVPRQETTPAVVSIVDFEQDVSLSASNRTSNAFDEAY